jgi:hypothetical protein
MSSVGLALNLLDWPNLKVVTMLAEIFMVRLEAAARASEEKAAEQFAVRALR